MVRFPSALCLTALGVVLAFAPAVAHGPVSQAPPSSPEAPSTLRLNRKLLDLGLRLGQAAPGARAALLGELVAAARARRQQLEALIDEHPGEVLRAALPPEERALLPAEVLTHLEEPATEEGVVEVLHADTPAGGRYLHALLTSRGRLALRLAGRLPDLLTGDRIRVGGVRLGAALAADGTGGVTLLTAAAPAGTIGNQPTLVIAVNFSDTPGMYTSASVDQFRQVVFGTGASVSGYVLEASYGRTWLSGAAVGPYAIGMASTTCDPQTLAQLARDRATAAGVNVGQYSRLVFAFPRNTCPWGGLGSIGGYPSQAWINGGFYAGIVSHELGHGFGLYHSHSLECGSVAIGGSCTSIDYGDTLDVMGASTTTYHLNAVQKERLGWLNATGAPPITTVQASGVYSLTPYEVAGAGAKALKVRLPSGDWYYVEYRQAIGFDAGVPTSVRNGVLVHLWAALDPDGMFLLDMTPATTSWLDPALGVAQTFGDPSSGISITPVWVSTTDAGVSVGLSGSAACVRANPTIAAVPAAAQGPPGSRLTYAVSVTNHDSSACPASTFAFLATPPAGWSAAFAAGSLTIAPGSTSSSALDVTSPVTAPAGSTAIAASTRDAADSARAAATAVTYTVADVAGGTVTDEFDRADAPALGNGWSAAAGELFIVAGEARNPADIGMNLAVLPALAGPSQVARASFAREGTTGAPRFGVVLRYVDAGNYYACYRQAGTASRLRITRVSNGAETVLAQVSVKNPAAGRAFQITCSAEGASLTLQLGGGPTVSATDATFTGGSVGLLMGHPAGTAGPKSHHADHWSATVQ